MGIEEIRKIKGLATLNRESGGQVKQAKPIAKRSDKMKDSIKKLKPLVKAFLSKHKKCEIQGPNCTKEATVVHHSEGRIGEKLLDVKTFVASCPNCNLYVEENDKWARDKGFKKQRIK